MGETTVRASWEDWSITGYDLINIGTDMVIGTLVSWHSDSHSADTRTLVSYSHTQTWSAGTVTVMVLHWSAGTVTQSHTDMHSDSHGPSTLVSWHSESFS